MAFPSAGALSYMWLSLSHPDPEGRTLRERWLPALEWFFSERVRQLTTNGYSESRATDASGTALSDEAVLEAADFGIFIDLASMCQKENGGARTATEEALFRHALQSLDVVYAHKGLFTLLSTRAPDGVVLERGYEDRGSARKCPSLACCRRHHCCRLRLPCHCRHVPPRRHRHRS